MRAALLVQELLHKNKTSKCAFVGLQPCRDGPLKHSFKYLAMEKHLILSENNAGKRLRAIHANLRPMGNIKNFRFRWQTSTKEMQRKCHKVQTRRNQRALASKQTGNRRANTNSIKAQAKVLPGVSSLFSCSSLSCTLITKIAINFCALKLFEVPGCHTHIKTSIPKFTRVSKKNVPNFYTRPGDRRT